MYHKVIPVGAVAAGGGVAATGIYSIGLVVGGATLLVAAVTFIALLPKLRFWSR
jgi:hypothetical protein